MTGSTGPHVLTCANGKGGSGKSTVSIEIALALAERGQRTLLIDLDQQGNATTRLGVGDEQLDGHGTAADVLSGRLTMHQAAVLSPHSERLRVLAGGDDLADVDTRTVPDLVTSLRDDLPRFAHLADMVVIDTPPALEEHTMCALAAANTVVAPSETRGESVDQIARLVDVMEAMKRRINPALELNWVVPTKFFPDRAYHRTQLKRLHDLYGAAVTPEIRNYEQIAESYDYGSSISLFRPRSFGAQAMRAALNPILTSLPTSRS